LAAIDVLNVDVDIPIKIVFEKRVDARMLKDEVLESILTAFVQRSHRVWLGYLRKACDPTAYLHPIAD